MYEAVQYCKHCGAGLALEDLRQPNCKFCKTVFPHHAQAAQHAQVASQMMGQMMQQQAAAQDQWRGAFGVGPMPPGPYQMGMAQMGATQAKAMSGLVIAVVVISLLVVVVMIGAVALFFVSV